MAKKEQKFETYSEELKKKVIKIRLTGMTIAVVAEELEIRDIGRLKVWMRKYRQEGEFGLMDHRGRRKNYVDQLSGWKWRMPC